jgi:mono/diheme cytochrome c family protein
MRRALAILAVGAALAVAGCGGDDEEPSGGGGTATEQDAPAAGDGAAADGKQLFASACGGCHTLEDAGTNGQVGPNLDDAGPHREQVLEAIRSGPSAMPGNLYEGAEAEAVADYVARVAGK